VREWKSLVGAMLTHSSAEILQKNQSDTDTDSLNSESKVTAKFKVAVSQIGGKHG
jgi:hypothetical protein